MSGAPSGVVESVVVERENVDDSVWYRVGWVGVDGLRASNTTMTYNRVPGQIRVPITCRPATKGQEILGAVYVDVVRDSAEIEIGGSRYPVPIRDEFTFWRGDPTLRHVR